MSLQSEKNGTLVPKQELMDLGFVPHDLEFLGETTVKGKPAVKWNTLGDIPATAGIYLLTSQDSNNDDIRVFYVGQTKDFWQITKGIVSNPKIRKNRSRPGQRYGRPKHSGRTRRRINREVMRQVEDGRTVQHWLRTLDGTKLNDEETRLIRLWNLKKNGWNRTAGSRMIGV
ncbi:MAG: hypothetical protein FWG25_02980 [Promicromonosporaceae bacterium]|nr:hypothetical protein [Promicromonosporaceae bacterium]